MSRLPADAPLAAATRARIVERCLEHRLLFGACAFATPATSAALSAARARAAAGPFAVGSQRPVWNDQEQDGGFTYLATTEPFDVYVHDAYRPAEARAAPHAPPDGWVGRFFDVLTSSARRAGDGRAMARSAFVRAPKAEVEVEVTCRASWW